MGRRHPLTLLLHEANVVPEDGSTSSWDQDYIIPLPARRDDRRSNTVCLFHFLFSLYIFSRVLFSIFN